VAKGGMTMKRTELKRRTPLKAGKPLKSGGKPKRKKKTALQKRIDKMDSPYWGNKCKAAVTAYFHTQQCFICGRREPQVELICGHHNIFKSMSRFYRWHPMNIVPMCKQHHLYDEECSPHRKDLPLTIASYTMVLKEKLPDYYVWWQVHEVLRKSARLMEGPKQRPDWRYQSTIWRQRVADAKIIRQE